LTRGLLKEELELLREPTLLTDPVDDSRTFLLLLPRTAGMWIAPDRDFCDPHTSPVDGTPASSFRSTWRHLLRIDPSPPPASRPPDAGRLELGSSA